MPLPLTTRRCLCRRSLDLLGDHRAACSNAGVLGARGAVLERAVARMVREAGATVGWNVMLRDLNLDEPVLDERRIEIVANGLPIWHGSQVAIDTTMVSPLHQNGIARPRADQIGGIAIQIMSSRKRHKYRAITQARRCRFVVFGVEVGGRWGEEALDLLRRLARSKARSAPPWMRASVGQAFAYRWSALISVAAHRALATSLLHLPLTDALDVDDEHPDAGDVLTDARFAEEMPFSRVV